MPVLEVGKARLYPWEQPHRQAVEVSDFLKKEKKERTEERGTDQHSPKNYGRKEKRKTTEEE